MSGNGQFLIFDLDDTLLNSKGIYGECLKSIGVESDGYEYFDARARVKSRLPYRHSSARNRILYFKTLLEARGRFSVAALLSMMSVYEETLSEKVREDVASSGIISVLEHFKELGYELGLITNENLRTQMIKIAEIDPNGRLFSAILTSEEAGAEKPSGKIFEDFFAGSNFVPTKSIFVGDNFEQDIVGACNFGIRAILVSESDLSYDDPLYLGCISHVKELGDFLKNMRKPRHGRS